MITKETRLESYIQRPVRRYDMILECLGEEEKTARMIATELGFTDMNAVKPRLTELKARGIVEVSGKAYDTLTKRNVALWKKVES